MARRQKISKNIANTPTYSKSLLGAYTNTFEFRFSLTKNEECVIILTDKKTT